MWAMNVHSRVAILGFYRQLLLGITRDFSTCDLVLLRDFNSFVDAEDGFYIFEDYMFWGVGIKITAVTWRWLISG